MVQYTDINALLGCIHPMIYDFSRYFAVCRLWLILTTSNFFLALIMMAEDKDIPISLTHAYPPHTILLCVGTPRKFWPSPHKVLIIFCRKSPRKLTSVSVFSTQTPSILMHLCKSHASDISFQSPHILLISQRFSENQEIGNRELSRFPHAIPTQN